MPMRFWADVSQDSVDQIDTIPIRNILDNIIRISNICIKLYWVRNNEKRKSMQL